MPALPRLPYFDVRLSFAEYCFLSVAVCGCLFKRAASTASTATNTASSPTNPALQPGPPARQQGHGFLLPDEKAHLKQYHIMSLAGHFRLICLSIRAVQNQTHTKTAAITTAITLELMWCFTKALQPLYNTRSTTKALSELRGGYINPVTKNPFTMALYWGCLSLD